MRIGVTLSSFRVSNETMMTKPIVLRAATAAIASLVVSSGCAHEAGPPTPARVEATSGEGQSAPVRTLLPEPVVARVVDATGAPLSNVPVDWSVEGDGRMIPLAPTTDAEGRVRARWVLGDVVGPSRARASVPEIEPATFTAIAQSPDQLPFDDIRVLRLPTYEGSGEVVHPDYVHSGAGSFSSPHHLAITPYPLSDPKHENPSHFVGDRPDEWALEPGAPNPVVRSSSGYLSDPDLLFVPETSELWLYYRQVRNGDFIFLIRSTDGIRWSPPVEVLSRPTHELVSPTVVRRAAGDWWMWAVNPGTAGCGAPLTTVDVRRSADGVHWSDPQAVELSQPDFWAWHIDVQWIPSRNEFWALYNAKTSSGCSTPALFLATSPDGYIWTVLGKPVLTRGRIPEFQDIVYRSTLAYDPAADAITFWYSGARHDGEQYIWSAAVERRRRADVFQAKAAVVGGWRFLPEAPALDEWP